MRLHPRLPRGAALLLLLLLVLPACEEPTAPVVTPERWLSIISGDQQHGSIARTLADPATVRVQDRSGQPLAGAPVEWRVIEGGGVVDALLTLTNAEGVASVTWTLGESVGQQLLMATVRETPAVTFRAEAGVYYTQVSAGQRHTCALDAAANAVCWGDHRFGQLGSGHAGGGSAFARVLGGRRFSAIYAGYQHTCGLDLAGAALCWGQNADAQLGDGTQISRTTPVPVAGGLRFTNLAVGGVHTCGVTDDGSVYCWGSNGSGQVGTSSDTCTFGSATWSCARAPVRVQLPAAAAAVTAGASHSCALLADGRAYCWGRNDWGELGVGRFGGIVPVPEPVAGGARFRQIAAGILNTCAVATDGTAYCWGMNRGALGTGNHLNLAAPAEVAGDIRFRGVQPGESHTCGLGEDGSVYCWGALTGLPAEPASALPVAAAIDQPFLALSVGGVHVCGNDGAALWCWGGNGAGQLGLPGAAARDRPTRIADALPPDN